MIFSGWHSGSRVGSAAGQNRIGDFKLSTGGMYVIFHVIVLMDDFLSFTLVCPWQVRKIVTKHPLPSVLVLYLQCVCDIF